MKKAKRYSDKLTGIKKELRKGFSNNYVRIRGRESVRNLRKNRFPSKSTVN